MLDIEFFGLDPKGHHIVNVIFHLINTSLLYFLLFGTTKSHWKSSFVAALFALHPLHVESVAWIAERKDVLCAFFFFITLNLYHIYVSHRSNSKYILALIAFSIGLMSKPMIVTLPFILLLLDYWPLQRISFSNNNQHVSTITENKNNNKILIKIIMEKLPFFALSVISCIITFYAQFRGGAVAKTKLVPISFRIFNSLVAYVNYIFKMILPINLSVIYPLPETITILHGLATGLLLAVISTISIRMGRRHPYLIVGWLWYIGMLVPVIGLVQVGKQSMADRYTYLPLTGLFIIVTWGIPSIVPTGRHRNKIFPIMSLLILLMYSLFVFATLKLSHFSPFDTRKLSHPGLSPRMVLEDVTSFGLGGRKGCSTWWTWNTSANSNSCNTGRSGRSAGDWGSRATPSPSIFPPPIPRPGIVRRSLVPGQCWGPSKA